MEFSELYELSRIVRSRKIEGMPCPLASLLKSKDEDKDNDKSPIMEIDFLLNNSGGSSISSFTESRDSLNKHPCVHIEKDTSYLDQSEAIKRSSLTLSLFTPDVNINCSHSNYLCLEIFFFFEKTKNIRIVVPREITVNDMLTKALISFYRCNLNMLPHGLDPDAYDVWIADEDTSQPDLDYIIDKKIKVATLGITKLCVCRKVGYKESIFSLNSGSTSIKSYNKPNLVHIKFFFENTSTVVAISPTSKLSDVLLILWKKFRIIGDLNAGMFEFRVFIEEGGYECALDMRLKINELPKTDIRLYRKILADDPKANRHKQTKSDAYYFNNNDY